MKCLTKNNKATIGGYLTSLFNAAMLIDWDNLDWTLISTYIKVIGGIIVPVFFGHITEIKTNKTL